jgi:hypothetical protein
VALPGSTIYVLCGNLELVRAIGLNLPALRAVQRRDRMRLLKSSID